MTTVVLAYGKGLLSARVPDALAPPHALLAANAPDPRPPAVLWAGALAEAGLIPVPPVAVVVPDGTRPAEREEALAALAAVLRRGPVDVVVGGGLHPARAIAAPWPVHVHDARAADLVDLGAAGTIPVLVHPVVARATTVIVVGSVMPHYRAGYSGGPKGLVPGVAGEATILAVHASDTMSAAIRACAARVRGRCWSLNLLVGARGPFDATAGPLEEAHAAAVKRHRAACPPRSVAPADVVVADAGGHPVDGTLLQAHKAYEAAARLVREGGTLLLVARCDGGFGHPEFERRLRRVDPRADAPDHPYARAAAAWHTKAQRVRTRMVTDLDVSGLGVEQVDLQDALDAIPAGARVLWAQAAHLSAAGCTPA